MTNLDHIQEFLEISGDFQTAAKALQEFCPADVQCRLSDGCLSVCFDCWLDFLKEERR